MDRRLHEARARVSWNGMVDPYTYAGSNLTSLPRNQSGPSSSKRQDTRQVGLPTAADFYVQSLPGLPNLSSHPTHPLNLYAGHLDSYPGEGQGGGDGDTGKDAAIFFMMAKARRSAGKQRVIFWFNGGPGCSSFDGSLMEVGPFRTVAASQTESGQVEVKLVNGGWEEFATIVFIDQPPGTGYSFVPTNGYLHELDQGSQHLMKFMDNFYHVFPELKSQDTYLAGESFAGQYIPYFASAIINSTATNQINLKGIAIGNGWIDPKQQYPGYVDFAYEKGLLKKDTPEAAAAEETLARCLTEADKFTDPFNTPVNIDSCGGVMYAVSAPYTQELNGVKTCMNVYDVRLVDDWPACGMNWPPDLPDVYNFLRRPDVITALHANKKETAWVECDGKVSSELHMKNSPAAVALIPHILDSGVKVMMFAGEEDLICNYKGIERSIANLNWGGAVGFSNSSMAQAWYLNDTQVGTWQEDRNMTFARVAASSHMVGFDVPYVTNDMILRFMDVDVSLVAGQAASSKSRVGDDERVYLGLISSLAGAGVPLLKGGNTDWESWYNAGSAILILLILCSIVGLYFYFRRRRPMHKRGVVGLPTDRERDDIEERIPLGAERVEMDDLEDRERRQRKGKGRLRERDEEERGETVFALGDEDEDDDLKDRR